MVKYKSKVESKTIHDLVGMVANGFAHMAKRFGVVDDRFDDVEARLSILEDGQEQIKLWLDNVAYRFELVEVWRRVDFLEKKAGVIH